MPAGTGVWVVNTVLARTTSVASATLSFSSRISVRILSSVQNPA